MQGNALEHAEESVGSDIYIIDGPRFFCTQGLFPASYRIIVERNLGKARAKIVSAGFAHPRKPFGIEPESRYRATRWEAMSLPPNLAGLAWAAVGRRIELVGIESPQTDNNLL
jgi:hypothetical protein